MILIAAVCIAYAAFQRLITPKPLEQIGLGLGVSIVASLVNLFVALVLLRASKKHNSIILEANAQHLMTDVWTSAGVIVGVGAVALTDWERIDPIVAFIVLVPGIWTVQRSHRLLESIEADIRRAIPSVTVLTHLEPLNDPSSLEDTGLDRTETPPIESPAKNQRQPSDGDAILPAK